MNVKPEFITALVIENFEFRSESGKATFKYEAGQKLEFDPDILPLLEIKNFVSLDLEQAIDPKKLGALGSEFIRLKDAVWDAMALADIDGVEHKRVFTLVPVKGNLTLNAQRVYWLPVPDADLVINAGGAVELAHPLAAPYPMPNTLVKFVEV